MIMIKRCKNCAGRVTYDIEKKGLVCDSCGSIFAEDEFKEHEEDQMLDVPEEAMIHCNIYQCSSCGAEISVTNTEASTVCIYCGNPTIVFSRVSKMKKPDLIIPFKITKEEAMNIINKKLKRGLFIPKSIKNFEIEQLCGIYIPYYITNMEYDGSYIFSSRVKSGKSTRTIHTKTSLVCSMDWVTTDASRTLSDDSSQRLEPYDKTGAVPFDENYLVGFYSDMADITENDGVSYARMRMINLAKKEMESLVRGTIIDVIDSRVTAEVYKKARTAMFPAWFLTLRYKDQPYTVIVNGQTGKLVGGMPWNKWLFALWLIGLSVIMGAGLTYLFTLAVSHELGEMTYMVIFITICMFVGGYNRMRKVVNAVNRASESALTTYVNKRQKGL